MLICPPSSSLYSALQPSPQLLPENSLTACLASIYRNSRQFPLSQPTISARKLWCIDTEIHLTRFEIHSKESDNSTYPLVRWNSIHLKTLNKLLVRTFSDSLQMMLNCHIFQPQHHYPPHFIIPHSVCTNDINDSYFHSSLTQESFGGTNYWSMRRKSIWNKFKGIQRSFSLRFIIETFVHILLFLAVNCRVELGRKYSAVMESVEIVISGDHKREVNGIFEAMLIGVIICRPWCVFSNDYLKRSPTQRGRAIVSGWGLRLSCRVKIQRQDVRSLQIKRCSCLKCETDSPNITVTRMRHDEDESSVSSVSYLATNFGYTWLLTWQSVLTISCCVLKGTRRGRNRTCIVGCFCLYCLNCLVNRQQKMTDY